MNSNRRKFLRNLTIGTGALATGIPAFANEVVAATDEEMNRSFEWENKKQRFNMCGYAAPKIANSSYWHCWLRTMRKCRCCGTFSLYRGG